MKEFLEIFSDKKTVQSYKFIEEFVVYIDTQRIGVKIEKDEYGRYHHSCSHHYQGNEQAAPYVSSLCIADSKKEAYINAHRELLSFYNANDENKKWVKSGYY